MKRSGPDSLESWIIASACFFINMMLSGMKRLNGIIFVASMPRFGVSREKASFPYTLSTFTRATIGPFVGYVGHKFGVRPITTFGCILAAIGVGTCYFAETITTVTVLWGVVFGLGFGFGIDLLPVFINQYFDKQRTVASGFSFAGASVGSIVLPPIVEILINNYGLSGTYLFLSGFILSCVAAALFLKKPNFVINKITQMSPHRESETQRLVSEIKVKLYTDDNSKHSSVTLNGIKNIRTLHNPDDENRQASSFTYEERIKRLSTQRLLSNNSIHMSTSEPLDADQIVENCHGKRQVNPDMLESDIVRLSMQSTDLDYEKYNVSENVHISSSQSPSTIMNGNFNKRKALSSGDLASSKTNVFITNSLTDHQDSGYKKYRDNFMYEATDSNFAQNGEKCPVSQSADNIVIHLNSNQNNIDNYKSLPESFKYISSSANILKNSDIDNSTVSHGNVAATIENIITKQEETTALGSFSIICDPMFYLISITKAAYLFTFVFMITIIVDFARDLNVGVSNEKYVLMTMSVGDLIGRLSLGWLTDGGYITSTNFAALCFVAQGVIIFAIAWSNGFLMLMILITLYGFSESGVLVIFPIIIADYIDPAKQTVAIPASSFLSGPVSLAVSPLIGYFRDTLGSYDFIFFGIGILLVLCSFPLFFAPYISRCRRNR